MTKNGLLEILLMATQAVPLAMTGGLADAGLDSDLHTGRGAGFVFHEYDRRAPFSALVRAIETIYQDVLRQIQVQGIRSDCARDRSARNYAELCHRALASRIPGAVLEAYEVHW
jgi:glycogen synthase